MIASHTLALFLVTQLAMALSPGPAVLLTVTHGARHGVRGGALAAAGIVTGTAVWVVVSTLGLTALLLASPTAFALIKWVGAAYLVMLGARMVLSRGGGALRADGAADARRVALQGVLTQLANPKAMLFFGALLPQFIEPARAAAPQLLVLGALTVVNEFLVLLGYAWIADRGARLAQAPTAFTWFDRVAGALLVGAGAKLALVVA